MVEALSPLTDPTKIGVVALLIAAVTAFFREWIVPGVTHTRDLADRDARIAVLTKERDEFKQMVLSALEITERSQRARSTVFTTKEGGV